MDTQPTFTVRDLLTHIIGDTAKALCDRPGESSDQCAARIQAVTHTIVAFQPGDAIEAMLAGHCAMFHEMIVDSVHDTLRGEDEAAHRPTRSGIVAMDKAFGDNLARLERYQTRRAEASPDAQPAPVRPTPVRTETDIADRVRRHQSRPPEGQKQPAQGQAASGEMLAACLANPEAMAALDAADPARFAKALEFDQPGEDYVVAAIAQMAGLNGHAMENLPTSQRPADAGNRQARRHPNP